MMDHLFHPWHWAPVLAVAPAIVAWWVMFRHWATLWAPWTTSTTQEVTVDEATSERQIAVNIVRAWFSCLTDTGRAVISDHDVEGLIAMIDGALIGDMDFMGALEDRIGELNAEVVDG